MATLKRRGMTALAGIAVMAVAVTGCSTNDDAPAEDQQDDSSSEASVEYPITVTDMAGNEVTIESADSVVVTDNRVFQIVADWGVQPTAAPRSLMTENNPMESDESILDIGTHGEPDFEQVVAADPDLVLNGYRFTDHADDMQNAAPDAAFVDMNVPEDDEISTDEYLIRSVTLLGEIFGKEDEAEALVDDFHAAVDEARNAYDPETTVMGLITSGNEIRYSSPTDGRGASIFFDLLELTPALDAEGSSFDQGDDISIEAIAEAEADFFLVLDREAAFDDGEATPAFELITTSPSLTNVPAVQDEAIYVMPADYYRTEDIIAYTTVLEELAAAFGDQ
ncbi:MAG TPA: ABC transporter substrate-binding protein [Candidatus Agrococcus pullicola]|uniref:ABC transporter substrate-binding protein n=1 Tax=Candidatus Agrococcus pullicola TaxID=2838429 RepID=A0A9D1Z023_9MICO|nr:ABC transporter substrate-binding protein [Candidatus Agrococcus pullicola]